MNRVGSLLQKTILILVITTMLASVISVAPIFADVTPTVTGISPTSGPATGETVVIVTGSGFEGGGTTTPEVSAVNFGTTAGTGLSVTSDTNLSITSPAGSGTVDITVVTSGGTSAISSADQFTYAPVPTITKINPFSGPAAGGTVVTVTGSGFYGGGNII